MDPNECQDASIKAAMRERAEEANGLCLLQV